MQKDLWIYILRRLVIGFVVLLFISFAVFTLLYISPGNVIDALLGPSPRTPEQVAFLQRKFNLDKPFLVQYWIWLKGGIQFHFGTSNITQGAVTTEIDRRLPTSLFLGFYAYLLTLVFGIVPGVLAALRNNRVLGRLIVAGSIVALCAPAFVTGVFLLYLFAIVWPIFPVAGRGTGFVDQLWHLTLPAVALALPTAAFLMRHTRASVNGVLNQDYVTFARARGLDRRRVLIAYVLRNALIPIVTASGLLLAILITGAVLVEQTFSVPGIGALLVSSATAKDLPMLLGLTMVVAVIVILSNLFADVAYAIVDPRVQLGKRRA